MRGEPEIIERASVRSAFGDHLAWWIATGGGSGLVPIAPGTAGAVFGVVLFMGSTAAARAFGMRGIEWIVLGLAFGLGLWASSRARRRFERADPPQVVVDEVVGQYLALAIAFAAGGRWPHWAIIGAGCIFFRVFDIWKPYPIRRVERWASGWGIMADDVLAGGYAGLATHIVVLIARSLL